MKMEELVKNRQYTTSDGRIVEFNRISGTGKWAIVHPPGEPDMQSSECIDPKDLSEVGGNRSGP